jgi:hypothetical protein
MTSRGTRDPRGWPCRAADCSSDAGARHDAMTTSLIALNFDGVWNSGCRGLARGELARSIDLPVRPAVNGGRGWQGACETRATRLQIKLAASAQCTPVPVNCD